MYTFRIGLVNPLLSELRVSYEQSPKMYSCTRSNCTIYIQLFIHKFLLLFSISAAANLQKVIHLLRGSIKISYTVQFSCFSLFCNWSTSAAKKYEIFFTCCVIFHRVPCKSFLILECFSFCFFFFVFAAYMEFHTIDFWHELCYFSFPLVQSSFECYFWKERKKMRVQWWIVAYTIVSIQRRSAGGRKIKHCIIMIFGLAVHLKSVHILPVWMRRKFRCTTTHKNSRRTYIFETDFKIISLILQCSSVYCMDGIEQVKAIGCGGGILVRKKSQFTRQPYQIFMISKPIKSRNFH